MKNETKLVKPLRDHHENDLLFGITFSTLSTTTKHTEERRRKTSRRNGLEERRKKFLENNKKTIFSLAKRTKTAMPVSFTWCIPLTTSWETRRVAGSDSFQPSSSQSHVNDIKGKHFHTAPDVDRRATLCNSSECATNLKWVDLREHLGVMNTVQCWVWKFLKMSLNEHKAARIPSWHFQNNFRSTSISIHRLNQNLFSSLFFLLLHQHDAKFFLSLIE